jgi:beta-phosphoglucomutase
LKRGILFDFDGVTVKSMEQHFAAWKKALADKNKDLKEDQFFVLEGQGIKQIAETIGRQFNLNKNDISEIQELKVKYYHETVKIEIYDYFFDLIQSLRKHQLQIGVVTGGGKKRVEQVLKQYFNGTFDCLVTIDDVEHGKPAPDPFLKGATLLGLKPEECIAVENAPLGVQSAKNAGIEVIAVTTTLPSDYLKHADHVVINFREVEKIILAKL